MLDATGCAGLALGRGALLNPWFFVRLLSWEETGDPGAWPTYEQRLDFMVRHFRLLVKQRGELFACLTFRKVANWYCKVLRPGRDVQQRLVQIDRTETFEGIVARLREQGSPSRWDPSGPEATSIAVPRGPIERW
jgi:tRNA-dihydrouridine synthase